MKEQRRRLSEENDVLCEQISKEGNEVLADMVSYIRRLEVSRYEQEKVRRDIAEMILEGEKRGIPARETIGDDYQEFCDSVLAELPKLSRREKALSVLRDASLFLAIWIPFWVFENFGSMDGTAQVNIWDGVWAILVFATGYVFNFLMSRQAFKKYLAYLLTGVMFISVVLIGSVIFTIPGFALFSLHIYAVLAVEIILIVLYVILRRTVE